MSWHVSPWFYLVWDSWCLLDLMEYFLFHGRKIFYSSLFKNFLIPFLFLFLRKFLKRLELKIFPYPFFFSSAPGTPIIRMLVTLMLSQRSLRLSYVLFFFLLYLIRSSASDILLLIPSGVFLILVIVLFVSLSPVFIDDILTDTM